MSPKLKWLTSRRAVIALVLAGFAVPAAWWFTAYPRGMIAAWLDGLRGHQEIQVFGLRRASASESARLLSARYGVETNRVAGCVVSEGLVWYVHGYNSVFKSRMDARYGRGVFSACAGDAVANL